MLLHHQRYAYKIHPIGFHSKQYEFCTFIDHFDNILQCLRCLPSCSILSSDFWMNTHWTKFSFSSKIQKNGYPKYWNMSMHRKYRSILVALKRTKTATQNACIRYIQPTYMTHDDSRRKKNDRKEKNLLAPQ